MFGALIVRSRARAYSPRFRAAVKEFIEWAVAQMHGRGRPDLDAADYVVHLGTALDLSLRRSRTAVALLRGGRRRGYGQPGNVLRRNINRLRRGEPPLLSIHLSDVLLCTPMSFVASTVVHEMRHALDYLVLAREAHRLEAERARALDNADLEAIRALGQAFHRLDRRMRSGELEKRARYAAELFRRRVSAEKAEMFWAFTCLVHRVDPRERCPPALLEKAERLARLRLLEGKE